MKRQFSNIFLTFSFILLSQFSFSQEKVNVILIGTFHFNNPGNDAIKMKNRNILSKENQEELEKITSTIIHKYKPDQIFVEEEFSKKQQLNNEYQIYLQNKFKTITDTIKNARLKKKYEENETYQLAFRLAKKSKNLEIFPIDDFSEFRFDLLMQQANKDKNLKAELEKILSESSTKMNKCISEEKLSNVLLCLNTDEERIGNKGSYIFINKIQTKDNNYFGSDLVTGWYTRNLRMYANFQNQLDSKSKNIVILVGAGHASMFYDFIKNDKNINLIELKQIL